LWVGPRHPGDAEILANITSAALDIRDLSPVISNVGTEAGVAANRWYPGIPAER